MTAAPTTSSATGGRPHLDWDDLRYLLAVCRAGTLSGAARDLGVTHTTILRRIDAMEARLQARLFERLRSGYVPTEAGEALRRTAEQCEPLVAEAERRIIGGDTRLTGALCVTTANVVAQHLLPSALAQFCAAHPSIEVQMVASRERIDLSRREADVALRMSAQVPEHLVGRKLGEVRLRVYAWHSAPFLSGKQPLMPIDRRVREFPWIAFERESQDRIYDRWLHANLPTASVAARTDHFPSALALLRNGMGVSLMPEFVALDAPGLVPLSEPIPELQTPLWILTHPDLRNTARVRVFMQSAGDHLAGTLASLQ